jgi:hypothetical protein
MDIEQISSGSAPILWSNVDSAFDKINKNFIELYNEILALEIGEVSWDSIQDKPTIPTDVSQLTDNQGLLSDIVDGGGA